MLIIGGGPAGMISALYLDLLGIPSILVERQLEISQHPKAHELSARSIEILSQLGLSFEALQKEASSYEDASKIVFGHTINHMLGEIDLKAGGNDEKYRQHLAAAEPYLNLSQTELEKLLRERLLAAKHCTVLLGQQWESMQETEQGVESQILDREQNRQFEISSKYVICADGAGSRSRKFLGIEMIGEEQINDFVSVYFEYNLRPHLQKAAKLYWIMHPEAPGTFIAHHIEKRWVFHFPIFPPYEKKEDFTKEVLKKRILTALGQPDIPLDVHSVSYWRMTHQVAAQFSKGRAFLIGDAAHRFPPTGGLGMNSGIGDAQNLCWKLAYVLKGLASEKLLASYEEERKPIIELNGRESLYNYYKIWEVPKSMGLNPNAMYWQARLKNSLLFRVLSSRWSGNLMQKVYDSLSNKIQNIPNKPALHQKVRKAIQDQIGHFDRIGLDLGYFYRQGAIIKDSSPPPEQGVSTYQPSICAGVRFPHFWIYEKGSQTSSHEWLCPNQFTLLCNERGVNWWSSASMHLPDSIRDVIQVRNISHHLKEQPSDAPERAYYPIEQTPLLLIRPDGQIAWRATDLNIDLSSIFNQLIPQE